MGRVNVDYVGDSLPEILLKFVLRHHLKERDSIITYGPYLVHIYNYKNFKIQKMINESESKINEKQFLVSLFFNQDDQSPY